MKTLHKPLLILNAGIILCTLLAYLAPVTDPKITWVLSFFGLFYPVFLILNLLFIGFWTFQKPGYLIFSLVTILLGWTHIEGFIGFTNPSEIQSDTGIKILTNNISNAASGYDRDKEVKTEKRNKLIDFLAQYSDVDIFCFQEVGEYAYNLLKEVYKDHKFHRLQKGAVILSRHPILRQGEIDFGTRTNSCLWADIRLPHDTVRVYSIHLQSNRITNDAEEIAGHMELQEKKTWIGIRGILRKYRNHHIKRSKQAELIIEHAAQSPHPVIFAGDFNDPPQSYTYHLLSKGKLDAFKEKGSGLGTTYAGVIPFLRIDYILADKELELRQCSLIRTRFSDHYPIFAIYDFPSSKT